MFDRLTDAFQGLYRKLSGQANISESNVRDAMGDVRKALLDADVHLDVVNAFTDQVLKSSLGREVTKSLKPGQEIIGIVHEELVKFLGGTPADPATDAQPGSGLGLPPGMPLAPTLKAPSDPIPRMTPGPTIVMMCGLQGSGKTTTCGKLAAFLKKRGRSVMLVAADLQRPAAVEQLQTVAAQVQSSATPSPTRSPRTGKPSASRFRSASGRSPKPAPRASTPSFSILPAVCTSTTS